MTREPARTGEDARGTIAERELFGIVREIELVEEDIRDRNRAKSDIYKEASNRGYDKKTIRKVVAARRLEPLKREEQDAIFDIYMEAIAKAEKGPVYARVENITQFRPKSERNAPEPAGEALSEVALPTTDDDTELSGLGMASGTGSAGGEGSNPSGAPTIPPSQPESSPDLAAIKATEVAPLASVVTPFKLRPHCLRPELCAGSGREHCHSCKQAMSATLQHEAVA